MQVRERIAAVIVVGVMIVLAMLIHGLTSSDQAGFEAASADIGWTDASTSDEIARDLFQRVNDERHARSLPPLAGHDDLADLARQWSHEMIETSYRHSDADFRWHPDFAGSGENITMGYRGAADVHIAWMESDSHRHAILSTEFTAIGVGVVCRNDGALWATEIFGKPHSARPADAPIGGDGVHPIRRRDDGPTCPRDRQG